MPRKPWSARGSPLVRRTSPQPGAAGELTELVRQCLLRPPQPDRLYVAQPGVTESRQLSRARTANELEPWEELIAVWVWSRASGLIRATPSSLIWTSYGVRIVEPRLRLAIGYDKFSEYNFRYHYTPGGPHVGSDVFELVIDGPTPWRSPNTSPDAELIADDLSRIKTFAAAFRHQDHP